MTNTTHEFGEEDDSNFSDDDFEFCQVTIPSSPGSSMRSVEVFDDKLFCETVSVGSMASRDRPTSTATVK